MCAARGWLQAAQAIYNLLSIACAGIGFFWENVKFESWYARIDPGAPFELLLEIFNQTQYLVMLPFCTMQLVSPLKRATTDISVATN